MTVNPLVARHLSNLVEQLVRARETRLDFLGLSSERGRYVPSVDELIRPNEVELVIFGACHSYGCSSIEAREAQLRGESSPVEAMRRTDVGNELATLLAVGHGAIAASYANMRGIWPSRLWFGDVTLPAC